MNAKEITRRIYVDAIPLGEAVALIEEAIVEEREACASILDSEVHRHRADQRRLRDQCPEDTWQVCGEPGSFCDEYGCGSLERFAAAIRARAIR